MKFLLCILCLSFVSFTSLLAQDKRNERIEHFFQLHDKNSDGQISQQELEDKIAFKLFDQNGDGLLTKEELLEKPKPPEMVSKPNDGQKPDKFRKRRFMQMDSNNDGQITRDEWQRDEKLFDALDKNGDGVVDKQEARHLREKGKNRQNRGNWQNRQKSWQQRLQRFDLDGDGQLSRDEWPGPPHLFQRLDRDQNGFIENGELPQRHERPGKQRQNGDNLRQMLKRIKRMDSDGDGEITRDEWLGAEEKFSRLDRNGDGVISRKDLRNDHNRRDRDNRNDRGNRNRRDRGKKLKNRLQQMDADQDGAVSQREWLGPQRLFNRLDRNKDGFISPDELPQMEQGKRQKQQSKFRKLLRQMDSDGDGRVTRDEWDGPEGVFETLDRNSDGEISDEDLR